MLKHVTPETGLNTPETGCFTPETGLFVSSETNGEFSLAAASQAAQAFIASAIPLVQPDGNRPTPRTLVPAGALVAGDQPVYTATGPKTAAELAASEQPFVGLVYDFRLGRYAARTAWVVEAGHGEAVCVTTDKGAFHVGARADALLVTKGRAPVTALRPKNRFLACSVNSFSGGYVRVGLWDGKKGKGLLHRMVVEDVMRQPIEGLAVHHIDGNRANNDPSNLQPLTSSEHAGLHTREAVERGDHVFQTKRFSHAGEHNGMHRNGAFYQDEAKVKRYRKKKRQELLDRDPIAMQKAATVRRALNTGHRIRNAGYTFATMDEYIAAHEAVVGQIARTRNKVASIIRLFGSIEGFVASLDRENHCVQSVEPLGERPLFAIVVSWDGVDPVHTSPVVIWPVGNDSLFGSGVAFCT